MVIIDHQSRGVYSFFFQAEDGIRDAQESRGLGDVYKRQVYDSMALAMILASAETTWAESTYTSPSAPTAWTLSLIHI